jgi:inward rectifier potassium channel
MIFKRQRDHHWELHLGKRHVLGRGLERRMMGDFFHRCMSVSWRRLLLWYFVYMLGVNLFFAGLFWIVPGAVTGPRPPTWSEVYFFAFEVFGTVSFGGFLPGNLYGHVVAVVEIIIGIASFAVMTGLTFARFTRPKAHLLFARHPVMTEHDGHPVLSMRVANGRHNFMTDAQAKLWLVANVGEGRHRMRRFIRLSLERDDSPLFALSWSLFHRVDASSPLYGLTAADLARDGAGLMLLINGFDETYGQDIRARHYYEHEDLRWNHRYSDIFSRPAQGPELVDFGKFHEVEPMASED